MSRSSISNSWPGAVRVALASAMDIDGVSLRTLTVLPLVVRRGRRAVEDGTAVEGELAHALADVLQGAVPTLFLGAAL